METERLSVFGDHNLENALAAITVACIMGINPKIIENVMSDFRLPDFRMQFIGRKGGKTISTIPKEQTFRPLWPRSPQFREIRF